MWSAVDQGWSLGRQFHRARDCGDGSVWARRKQSEVGLRHRKLQLTINDLRDVLCTYNEPIKNALQRYLNDKMPCFHSMAVIGSERQHVWAEDHSWRTGVVSKLILPVGFHGNICKKEIKAGFPWKLENSLKLFNIRETDATVSRVIVKRWIEYVIMAYSVFLGLKRHHFQSYRLTAKLVLVKRFLKTYQTQWQESPILEIHDKWPIAQRYFSRNIDQVYQRPRSGGCFVESVLSPYLPQPVVGWSLIKVIVIWMVAKDFMKVWKVLDWSQWRSTDANKSNTIDFE